MFTKAYEYRFYVGLPDKESFDLLVNTVASMFSNATITKSTGIWQSETEYCAVVTIVTDRHIWGRTTISKAAVILRDIFGQNYVMVTEHEIGRAFV